ncbi:hypothetical protein Bbelb_193640 [Branchiostoma belcheri]|nr:hypothetical protein Bbelb_193640 [Branchiostoma belcheri]
MGSVICDTRAAWSQRAGFHGRSGRGDVARSASAGRQRRGRTIWGRTAWPRQMQSSLQAWFTGSRLGRTGVVARSDSVWPDTEWRSGVSGGMAAGCQGSSRCGRVAGWRVGQHGSDGGGRVLLSRGCWLVGRHRRDGVG